jgi:hypothetical protein
MLPSHRNGEFGSKEFAVPAMKTITKCAYFTYQQSKVYFRTDKHVRKSARRGTPQWLQFDPRSRSMKADRALGHQQLHSRGLVARLYAIAR